MRYDITQTEEVKSTFLRLGRAPAVLYENRNREKRTDTAVLVMHSDSDYLSFSAGIELASRGFSVLCANAEPDFPMFLKMMAVKDCIDYLRKLPEIEKVVLFGHSGGATLMSAYQSAAETGGDVFRHEGMIMEFPKELPPFPAADGLMLIDPNWGNGAMTLFAVNPAIVDEKDPSKIDPQLDLFHPANGFDPEGSHYSDAFIRTFQEAQGARMNRLIAYAQERLHLIESGKGMYEDDEPLMIPGADGNFMNNKLYAQDISLFSHTKEKHILLHAGKAPTYEIVHSVRTPQNSRDMTRSYRDGILKTSVRDFLDARAVRTAADYHFDESGVYGIEWDSCYCCTVGNIKGVTVPLLLMGMTAGWEYASVEEIARRAQSRDMTVAYVEGASHMYCPDPGVTRYGDTLGTVYDFIAGWLHGKRPQVQEGS